MKTLFTIMILIIYVLNTQSQTFIDLFNMGTEEFHKGNLKKADSLYTLSINTTPNKDAYFNRGMVRKVLQDNCGFCDDMKTAYFNFSDEDALIQFGNNCIENTDTAFFSKRFVQVDAISKPRYYDVTFDEKCYENTQGLIFDNNRKYNYLGFAPTSAESVYDMRLAETNVYAQYYLIDSTRIYTSFINMPTPDFRGRKKYLFNQTVREIILNDPEISGTYQDEYIYIISLINQEGKLISIKLGSAEIIKEGKFNLISDTLKVLLNQNYKYTIGKIFKEPVTYEYIQRF